MKRFVKGDDDRNDDNDDDGETTRPSQQTRLHSGLQVHSLALNRKYVENMFINRKLYFGVKF